ncbi:hypothetical protein E0K89_014950, partial [Aquicoccus sp. SCR17]|nr:hypothetical protein [Carideicomes alvinocaridis]
MSALTPDMLRLALAAMVAGAWLLVAVRRRGAAAPAPGQGNADTLVLFASESGLARDLAQAHAARLGAEALPLDAIRPETLTGVARAWLLLASHGEGEAPRNGTAFAARLTTARPDLAGLRYGLLALGDRSYPTFCAFGRRVDAWLVERGATPLFPRVEVDRAAPADLARWDAALRDDTGAADRWRLARRERLSAAEEPDPVYRLLLEPERDVPPWTPGAIADVALLAPDGSPQRRSYSVASLHESGAVELILRRRHDAEGLPGLGSAWLTAGLAPGGAVRMSLRDNPTLPALQAAAEADRPLLLIATGT